MARERGGPLLAQLARLARLLELSCDVEEDCSRVARGFESCRQRCCRLGLDLGRAREQLLAAESECSALRVKLKHARNQVEVEMGKRHRAEAELEKQERKLQLICDFLMQESPSAALSEGQRSALALLEGPRLGTALAPGSRLSAVNESRTSLTSHSDISYDRTEDDVDLDVTVVKPLKRKSQERPRSSLAPLIGPVVPAKRSRHRVLPAASASEAPGTLPAGAVAEDRGRDRSLLPAAVVPVLGRRSRQGRRLSTLTGDPPRVLLRLRLPRPLRAGGAAVPAVPPAAAPRVPRALPRPLHPWPPAPAPGGRPGRLRAPHGPPGARPGGAVRQRGGAQGPDGDIPDEAACQAALCHVVSKLPPANRETLAFLMLHLLRVAQSPECRMDELNLARIFGPTLVGHSTSSPTPLAILEDTPQQCKVMARLLSLPPEFWRRFVGMELENLVPAATSDPLALDKRERLFRPLSSPEVNSTQLSPTGCCLPDPRRSCVGTAGTGLQVLGSRKTGRFFPSLL
ncbi:rac GTPase-activating protein 1-like isoform X2 [Mauremys mutica]|uniref:rac GTPase-activating protein 1-like isoform X2 n=1 Tax=Mauremys mutica TaxID=74926 RepID=UPI001D133ABE|nr:rac GTPase-activating protein 1-like isoform X2 [Mauremys mutica]